MPIKSFADQTAEDIYHGIDSKAARRLPKEIWKQARRKMELLNGLHSTLEMANNSGLRFKSLKYDRPGFDSIRVNDNFRIFFQFKEGNAYAVGIENDHGRKTS